MTSDGKARPNYGDGERKKITGRYTALSADGEIIWEKDGFTMHVDQVPQGISMTMAAGYFTDAKGVEVFRYDPHRKLPPKK